MKTISTILAVILIFFGVLFIWASFGQAFNAGWFVTGLVTLAVGFGLLWFANRKKVTPGQETTNVTYQIDLPGGIKLESLKCESCGGVLSSKDIQMLAGAPVVNCPYCKSSYQLTEQPKW